MAELRRQERPKHSRSPIDHALRSARSRAFKAAMTAHNDGLTLDQAGQEAVFHRLCAAYVVPPHVVLTDDVWESVQDKIWRGIQSAARAIANHN